MLTALLIMLREGFEAALVVAIVYAYIRRIDRRDLIGPMWLGMAAAAALSIAAGLVSRTVLWLQAAGELGTFWNNVYDLTAYRWLTVGSETGRFLGAMVGWDPRPSIEQVVAYLLFLVTVSWLFLRAPSGSPAR